MVKIYCAISKMNVLLKIDFLGGEAQKSLHEAFRSFYFKNILSGPAAFFLDIKDTRIYIT